MIKALHNQCFCVQDEVFCGTSEFVIGGINHKFLRVDSTSTYEQRECFRVEVVLALSNKKDAYGLVRAKNLGIKTQVLESVAFKERVEFDKNLVEILKPLELDLCVLAGFMRILTPLFTHSLKAVNIHPSLLPLFKGAHGIVESYHSAMKLGGVSVHFVNDELDGGELIAQGVVVKRNGESLESYEARVHKLEHYLYPLAVLEALKG
ncbi:phosphoribosylglycinamide formyltransferase [Helicobacter sp. Faydin-H64]|uniref:phosphoribosylglycinamide formyltransferase 1 n=1 Tax=Helicobacter turcicus TaxID=2867412 RepID=A0ABS7JM09_9HELI|nr:formyltransferase family protein [Helicobacter turcicus]MBX7490425.1 phosphoribosylglycinamide formyltransferase [Helicobacter turcicus]MBX7545284.1 phosphoribosylglycinamide formyltransferase [Helicobacter turcicus]